VLDWSSALLVTKILQATADYVAFVRMWQNSRPDLKLQELIQTRTVWFGAGCCQLQPQDGSPFFLRVEAARAQVGVFSPSEGA